METHPFEDFHFRHVIAEQLNYGLCAHVYRAICSSDGSVWAARVVLAKRYVDSPQSAIARAAELFAEDDNFCVCKAMYIKESRDNMGRRIELYDFMPGEAIIDHMGKNFAGFSLEVCRNLVPQLARAIHRMHTEVRAVHGDLKPDNILVSSKNLASATLKLADWDMLVVVDDVEGELMYPHGTQIYQSPEQRRGTPMGAGVSSPDVLFRSEMYTVGMVLYSFFTGGMYKRFHHDFCMAKLTDRVDGDIEATTMIDRLLRTDPKERWTAEQLEDCYWMRRARRARSARSARSSPTSTEESATE